MINKTLVFILSVLLCACAGKNVSLDNKIDPGDKYTTLKVSYENIVDNDTLSIKVTNISFDIPIKSEIYAQFFNDDEELRGYNISTSDLDENEFDVVKIPIPNSANIAKIHFDEYDARISSYAGLFGVSDEYDYHNFGGYYILLSEK